MHVLWLWSGGVVKCVASKVIEIMLAALETALAFVAFVTDYTVEQLRAMLEKWWQLQIVFLGVRFVLSVFSS